MSKLVTQLIDENIKDLDFEPVNHLIQGKFIKRKTTKKNRNMINNYLNVIPICFKTE
ncbi:MAG: hypothetical protein CM1200mP1_13960 [Candidatus Neomarinimicrobiota bacterium]|nr:MAG: hypothetical protein CM1200mP1_13960 [Candidatus Neomarinimicrobiota bacterium]